MVMVYPNPTEGAAVRAGLLLTFAALSIQARCPTLIAVVVEIVTYGTVAIRQSDSAHITAPIVMTEMESCSSRSSLTWVFRTFAGNEVKFRFENDRELEDI